MFKEHVRTPNQKTRPLPFRAGEFQNRLSSIFRDVEVYSLLGSWENFVFDGSIDGHQAILRMTESSRRTEDELRCELEWVSLLAENQVPVARPLLGFLDNMPHVISINDDDFYLCMFEFLEGAHLDFLAADPLRDEVIESWGSLIAKMHNVARLHSNTFRERRRQWWEDQLFGVASAKDPEINRDLLYLFEHCCQAIGSLERTDQNFGLIHADLHGRNVAFHNEKVYAFDFDDLIFGWFEMDLAVWLNWLVNDVSGDLSLFKILIDGYRKGSEGFEVNLECIDLFARFRWCLDFLQVKDTIHKYTNSDAMISKAGHMALKLSERRWPALGSDPLISDKDFVI